jgi:phosphoribosylformylglycinamidine synthase
METIVHYYRKTEPPHSLFPSITEELKVLGLGADGNKIEAVETESCFNVLLGTELVAEQQEKLEWLLAETFDRDSLQIGKSSFDTSVGTDTWKVEFGPRMTFTSAFSSNAVGICQACNLPISRLELSRRYLFTTSEALSDEAIVAVKAMLHDRMTEEEYAAPLKSFDSGAHAKPVRTIPIMAEGRGALEIINKEMGLGFDDFDLDYYTNLFKVSAFGASCVKAVSALIHTSKHLVFRRNWDEIPPTSSVSTWDSQTQNIRATGSSAVRW